MGTLFGRKKYTNFFSYAKAAVTVLCTIRKTERFTTAEFVKAFNALRIEREEDFNSQSDKAATAANDSLRTLVKIGCISRIKIGVYELIFFVKEDARFFNKWYPIMKDPNRNKKGEKHEGKN